MRRPRSRWGLRGAATAAFVAMVAGCTFITNLDGLAGPVPPDDASLPLDGGDSALAEAASDGAATDGAACTPVTNGLLGHWTMDTASVLGTRVADTSGKGNDGTIFGAAPAIVPGRFGEALEFPASSASSTHVEVPSLSLDTAASGVTSISLWFFRSGVGIDDVLIDIPGSPRFDLWLTGDSGHLLCFNTQSNSDCWGIDDPDLRDRWVHVVALFHNGPLTASEMFVDGKKRVLTCTSEPGQACDAVRTVGLPLSLGGRNDFFFHGRLDDVRVYRRGLTAVEVAALHDGTACP
ncbi:MAG: hypothetical protein JWO86_3335 [Myxococcaceae bacterium]|nr:hypothetical protein [Myxococcaceae bacterium]MEA2750475.1 biosis protein MshQ [Myxococcales bacterium]